jgi:hypothetical protein
MFIKNHKNTAIKIPEVCHYLLLRRANEKHTIPKRELITTAW